MPQKIFVVKIWNTRNTFVAEKASCKTLKKKNALKSES